jgi:hypothetical protein
MKTYCFGDSFIGMFTLVNKCKVFKYKGATAKGLTKAKSQVLEKIQGIIGSLNTYTRRNNCFLFQFGSVDIHHSYFYKILTDPAFNADDIPGFIDPIVQGYVKAIASLDCAKKIILAPHYSPIDAKYVMRSLLSYGIIDKTQVRDIAPYVTREWRTKVVDYFCDQLRQLAPSLGMPVIDLRHLIAEKGVLHEHYITPSKRNIHIMWEPLLLIYLEYLKVCGITREDLDLSNMETYIARKTSGSGI